MEVSGPSNDFLSNSDVISLYKAVQDKRKELTHVGNYITYSTKDEEVHTQNVKLLARMVPLPPSLSLGV